MNGQLALVLVSEISGGIIAVLALSLLGTYRMLSTAKEMIEAQRKSVQDSIDIATRANEDSAASHQKFLDLKAQVTEWAGKPMAVTALVTDEQVRQIADQVKGGSFGETVWPSTSKKVM